MGYIYLLHFDPPVKHAGHYIGYTENIQKRLAEHLSGNARAGRLPQVAVQRGSTIRLARIWNGDRSLERRLKDGYHGPRVCPICNPNAHRYAAWGSPHPQIDLDLHNVQEIPY